MNIISQIIYLAKIARKHVEREKYGTTKRLFRRIINLEKEELALIKEESGSDDFYRECLSIQKQTIDAFKDTTEFKIKEAIKLLDRIISLGQYQLEDITKRKKGLDEEILETIDPYIRELVAEINKLSFVRRTHFSCSGHFPGATRHKAYIMIEYDWESRTKENIKSFHNGMIDIVAEAGINRPKPGGIRYEGYLERVYHQLIGIKKITYYLGFAVEIPTKQNEDDLKAQFLKQWKQISKLVAEYKDQDSLEYKKQRKYITENKDLLGQPEKLVQEGIIVQCPRCGSSTVTRELQPKCKKCGFIIGTMISRLLN